MEHILPICRQIFFTKAEVPNVFEATLPEYSPGIIRTIRTDCLCTLSAAIFENGIISVKITAEVRIVYISEQKNYLKSAVFPFEFTHTFDASRTPPESVKPELQAKVFCVSCSAKPKGARSFEIKLNTAVSASLYICEETELYSETSGGDTELRMQTATALRRNIFCGNADELHEEITLDSSMPPAAEIADFSLTPILDKAEAGDGAIKFYGTAEFKCTYRAETAPDEARCEYIHLSQKLPFSGEITAPGISYSDKVYANVNLKKLEACTAFDPYGENRIVGVSAVIECEANVFGECRLEYSDDGYCAGYECSFKTAEYSSDILTEEISERTELSESFAADRTPLTRITDTVFRLSPATPEISDGKLYLDAKASVSVFGTLENGEPDCIQTVFSAKFPIESAEASPEKRYILSTQILSAKSELKDGEITVTAIAETQGAAIEKNTIRAISDAQISYDSPKALCRSEYIIYYPEKSETLWDIAKKYEIPQKTLAEANGIDESGTFDKKTVLIPCSI